MSEFVVVILVYSFLTKIMRGVGFYMKNTRPEVETNPYLYEDECDLPDEETLREIWGVDVDELSEEEKELIRNR